MEGRHLRSQATSGAARASADRSGMRSTASPTAARSSGGSGRAWTHRRDRRPRVHLTRRTMPLAQPCRLPTGARARPLTSARRQLRRPARWLPTAGVRDCKTSTLRDYRHMARRSRPRLRRARSSRSTQRARILGRSPPWANRTRQKYIVCIARSSASPSAAARLDREPGGGGWSDRGLGARSGSRC